MSGNWQDGIDWTAPDPVELARDGIIEDEQGRLIFAAEGTAAHQPALVQYEEAQNLADAWHDYDEAEAIWQASGGDEASL